MKFCWLYVQYSFLTICCYPSGKFNNKRKWITLIKQPEFTFWFISCSRVHKDPTFYKITMNISNHAADISLRIRATVFFCFCLAFMNIISHSFFIPEKMAMINGLYVPCIRTFYIRMAQCKLTNRWIKSKPIYATSRCIYKHSA